MKKQIPTRALYLTKLIDDDGKLSLQYQQFFNSLDVVDENPFDSIASTGSAANSVMVGTNAARASYPASAVPDGAIYYETDRTTLYIAIAGVWTWLAGRYTTTLSGKPTLVAADAGFLFYVTDYDHLMRWDGSVWGYGTAGDRAGYIQQFLVDPSPTTGWSLCDGAANVAYLKSDCTTATQTLPDLTSAANNAAVVKLGSPASATPNAAVSPGLTGLGATFAGTPATPTGAVGGNSGSFSVASGVANTTSLATHTHTLTMNSYTPAGTISFSGGSVDNTGEMRNLVLRPWFRR